MRQGISARGFCYWLRAPRDYADFTLEQWLLAAARLLICLCFFISITSTKAPSSGLSTTILFLFTIYSALICFVLRSRVQSSPAFHVIIHCVDVLWAAQLALVIEWPGFLFVLLFFLLISSQTRWGFWETLLTGGSFSILWLAGGLIYGAVLPGRPLVFFNGALEFSICLLMSLVSGFLAESRLVYMERDTLAAIAEGMDGQFGLNGAIQTTCNTAVSLFQATRVIVVIHDRDDERAFLFRADNSCEGIRRETLAPEQLSHYFFPAPAANWRMKVIHRSGATEFRCAILSGSEFNESGHDFEIPEAFLFRHPLHLLLGIDTPFQDGFFMRTFIIDPNPWFSGSAGLRFLARAAQQITPAFQRLFLVERIKSQAQAEVHQKLARELHDGAIQSLTGISLQLDQLWRCAGPALAAEALRLATIQKNLREEIAALREFTTELRSLDLNAVQLIQHLSQLAVKFQFDSDIAARFISDVDEVQLRPDVCVEVARIAQEALANVRKHSGAGEVLIRFNRRNGDYLLAITDNGCGFKFAGRRSHEELRETGAGPIVILERAREIQAKVEIESMPGSGSSIEVRIPINV